MSCQSEHTTEIARVEALLLAHARVSEGRTRLLTVEDVADFLDVENDWVYARTDRLGGLRLGAGRNAPIRFEPRTLAERIVALSAADGSAAPGPGPQPRRNRGRSCNASADHLIPIRGRTPADPAIERAA